MSQLINTALIDAMDDSEGPDAKTAVDIVMRPNSIKEIAANFVRSQTPSEEEIYPSDVVEFYDKVFDMKLAPFQEKLLRTIENNRYVAVTTATSTGKTYSMARFVLYWLHKHPNSIVLTTGPSGRQVRYVMWANVRDAADRAKMPLMGEAMVDRYQIGPSWFGYGFKASKENISALQGFHADNFLVIIDEATGVPDSIVDVLRTTMMDTEARFVMLSNPVATSGRLYEAFNSGDSDWETIQIGFKDTPNFHDAPPEFLKEWDDYEKGKRDTLPDNRDYDWTDYPPSWRGMINWPWVMETIRAYGEDSAYVRSRIWGQFVSEDDVLIPQFLIDRAKNKEAAELPAVGSIEAGLDVGRYGGDKTVLTIRKGPRIIDIKWWVHKSTTDTVKMTINYLDNHYPGLRSIKVDGTGLGAGVVDQLQEKMRLRKGTKSPHYRIKDIVVGRKSSDKTVWRDQRQEGFNNLAKLFRRGQIAIGPDEQALWAECGFNWPVQADAELGDIQYTFDDHIDPVVEKKEDYKKRRGHSPDFADSIMLAFFNPRPPREEGSSTGTISQGSARIYKKAGSSWRRR